MRWTLYLLASLVMQVVAWIVTPLLPVFAEYRYGPIDNNNALANEPRLPNWLSWFMTVDNSLYGDNNWKSKHYYTKHWSMVGWLYRNSLYGYKWSVLSAPMDKDARDISGPSPTWKTPGFQRIRMGDYWQWHLVKVIGPIIVNFNFGWLLNDGDQERALFMFSPRIKLSKS